MSDIYSYLAKWTVDMLGDSTLEKCPPPKTEGKTNIDEIRDRYIEGLYVMADTNDAENRFK